MKRREFIQTCAGAALAAGAASGQSDSAGTAAGPPIVRQTGDDVQVEGTSYRFEWTRALDRFVLRDAQGRQMTTGPAQPLVLVQPVGQSGGRVCSPGQVKSVAVSELRLVLDYTGANGSGELRVVWRFDPRAVWLDAVEYQSSEPQDVVSLHYFATSKAGEPVPALAQTHSVIPGISMSSGLSPIIPGETYLKLTSWLGRCSDPAPGLFQQWGLPVHYFCGFHRNAEAAHPGALREHLSDAYCCGLADLPAGDLYIQSDADRQSLVVRYAGDVWKHLRTPGRLTLGATLVFTVGPNFRESIRAYYQELMRAGIVRRKQCSDRKKAVMMTPQFSSWGEQMALHKYSDKLDEVALERIYKDFKRSGMRAGLFEIDDKWEGHYGQMEHSAERLPHFEEFLNGVHADGFKVGLWAAFIRCQNPAALGLDLSHVIHTPGGKPVVANMNGDHYILDLTQPVVQDRIRETARRFARRYKPDLIKFDFGYEMPPIELGAPKDMRFAGEKLLFKAVEIVVSALREENPDIVLMYYNLSPLFVDYIDQHSPDDPYVTAGEYWMEFNRRFFFSSVMCELGVPTYGSNGYDWLSAPDIWFDSVACGTLGSMQSFAGDEQNSGPTPEAIAKYNGLTRLVRQEITATVVPLDAEYLVPQTGAHTSSWVRMEDGKVVLAAFREHRLDGRKGVCRFEDLISTTASVVVASRTADGLAKTSKLGLVPYGGGEVRLRRADSAAAQVSEHGFDGNVVRRRVPLTNGELRLAFRERADNGAPVEWLEVDFV